LTASLKCAILYLCKVVDKHIRSNPSAKFPEKGVRAMTAGVIQIVLDPPDHLIWYRLRADGTHLVTAHNLRRCRWPRVLAFLDYLVLRGYAQVSLLPSCTILRPRLPQQRIIS